MHPTSRPASKHRFSPYWAQFFSGHGGFGCHLVRIRKSAQGLCPDCRVRDDPVYRLTTCPSFTEPREGLRNLSIEPTSEDLLVRAVRAPSWVWKALARDRTEEIKALEDFDVADIINDPDDPGRPATLPRPRPRRDARDVRKRVVEGEHGLL